MTQNISSNENSGTARVRAVHRAMAIIGAFTPERTHLKLTEIAHKAQLDAGTARRLLVTLRDEGVIGQEKRSGRYFLTMQILRWAAAVPASRSLLDIADPHLNALSRRIGVTVFLSVLSDTKAVCLARYQGSSAVQVRWWSVGGTLPLNCGAAPRLLWAFQREDLRERILGEPFIALTPSSLIDPDRMRVLLARIRRNGWCYTEDDVVEGLSALAGPLRDTRGNVVAAVSLGGLRPTLENPEGKSPPPLAFTELMECCNDISHELARENYIS
ncbi:IclR family transcriptional regulator [Roseovarius nanhaiticus]|uniref:IclR family transcriptional regulator n=1 Tax=Roseovarius nanhaiticus TaxID=573024 RepID=UPI002492894D|nr:IclR family transcriptional regulator [Roseovarius nanhaiticus]